MSWNCRGAQSILRKLNVLTFSRSTICAQSDCCNLQHQQILLLTNLMDCERKVNDFPLTTDDALAFTISHCLQSILQTEITASIIGGDIHKTTGTPGRQWLIQIGSFSENPGRSRKQVPQVHGFPSNKALNNVVKDRWTSPQVYQCIPVSVWMQVILAGAAEKKEHQAAEEAANNQTEIRELKTVITALNETSTDVCNSLKASQFVW